jgi:hypothetical protein
MVSDLLRICAEPSQPGSGTPGVLQTVEFTMTKRDAAPRGDLLDLFRRASLGVFPGPALEALIGRLEAGK